MLLAYVLLAVLVIVLSLRLSGCVDALDKQTNLSGAFLGGVMLAAVTSLPELFTSLSAVAFLGEPEMVVGNILGSNLFNMAALAVVSVLLLPKVLRAPLSARHRLSLLLTAAAYGLLGLVAAERLHCYLWGLNLASWLILLLYALGIFTMSAEEETLGDEDAAASASALLGEFAALAVLLVSVSIMLTLITERLKLDYALEASLAGALFLGVATSLPELVSTFGLLRLGNFNAACGNIMGSNLFNFAILSAADLLYTSGTIYLFEPQSCLLLALGLLAAAALLPVVCLHGWARLPGLLLAGSSYAVFLWLTI